MKWICSKCGQDILTMNDNPPSQIKWTDGHICSFVKDEPCFTVHGVYTISNAGGIEVEINADADGVRFRREK